jgi:fructan beta-fructosidase
VNYGADGNDYFQFTTPSLAFDKASGITTLIAFAMHVDTDGTLEMGGSPVCKNGVYVGPANWGPLVSALKTAPTTVTRYEVCIGGWLDTSYDNVKSLVAAQGTGPASMLYQNFQALKIAVPGIDAINDDDEKTYDLSSSEGFANLLGGLGYKFTLVPYTAQSFWVSLYDGITNYDEIYLQCYEGGEGNDPGQWNTAFGHGAKVLPGQESNTATPATFRSWYLETGAQGGFYYPDVTFSSTYWSAAVIEANGLVPATPTGLAAAAGGGRVKLAWNGVPGAISYNVKRSTRSGGEVTVASLSTSTNSWPAANQFFDVLPSSGVTNYYVVSAVNTNGESLNSAEVSASAAVTVAWFKADAITGLANGAAVASWSDASGHGFTATQAAPGQQPIYMAGALNGLPVVHFTGTNSQVLALARPVQDSFTIFCVFRSTQGGGSGSQFDGGAGLVSGTAGGVANDFGVCFYANGQVCAGVGQPGTSVSSLAGYADGNPHLLTFRRTESSGEVDLYVDGNFQGSVMGNTNSLTGATELALGAQQTLNNYLTGDIAEVKIYGAALSEADRTAQEAGLIQKWGVSGALSGLLAYEGFAYPTGGGLAGQNGGIGWSNGWMDVSGNTGETVGSGSLVGGGDAPTAFDARSAGNATLVANGSRGGRWLDCSTNGNFALAGYLNASGNIGAPGKTLYVSFLQQPNSPVQFYEFEFHRGNLSDGGRIAGIGNDLANATTINLRAPDAVQTPFGWGNANVNFYVVRIDYHGGSDDVYVYRNPTGANETNNAPALTMPGVADLSFNGISLGAYLNGVTVNHDEIRLGETWTSALGNPPVFVTQPTNEWAYAGQDVTLAAQAQASEPLSYQWYGGGAALAGQTNAGLTLADAQLTDANRYWVTASNALGLAVSGTATLAVQTLFAVIDGPQSLTVGAGSNLLLSAAVGGAAPMALQWYRAGSPLAGATNAALGLGGAGVFDAGQYFLVAANAYGSVTSSVVNVVPNFGGLLAYEGFNYDQSTSDIAGANGGFGWSGAWVSVDGGASQTFSNSLTAGANAPPGYDGHSLPGSLFVPNASRKGRFLDCSAAGNLAQHGYLDSNGNLGADGTTVYLSFLQQPSSTIPFYEFELKRGELGDAGRIAGIGDDVGSGNDDANLRIESPAGGNSTFYDLGPGSTNVNFYVLRIDYHNGNDTVTVYRNPTSPTEPVTATLTVSNVADLSFDGISFGAYLNTDTVAHDEVRLGVTWADVVGGTLEELRLAHRTNGTSSLWVAASPNYIYPLQGAPQVTGPWTNIGSVTVPNPGIGQFVETNATAPQRFYRALAGTVVSGTASGDVVADFEQATYGTWTATGTAFGSGPAQGTLPNQQTVSGYEGSGLVNSYNGGDGATGTLTSAPFVIARPYLDFLIGGGDFPGLECMNLIVSNVVVQTATGGNSETLSAQQWDVTAYVGQTATLQIVDAATGSWGHILVDEITMSDLAFPALSRVMVLTNNLLNLPAKNGATMKRVTVTVGGNAVRDFNIELADGQPDWWAFVDVSAFAGQTATVSVSNLAPGSTGLSAIVQTNGIVGATNLYQETLRPQVHFSTKRGWLNDANGMFYYLGQYHLYYQHDPFNWDGSGQKYWGHAESPDMINWQELPEGIYSHSYGDDVWSGSAVVDTANTSGFQTGTNKVIVAAYYSTARSECIDYSNDGGMTFTDYPGNPVVVNNGRDPHLVWYAPSNYWVMAVYDATGGNGISFYSSPNLKQWTYHSKIYGFFECPDIFQLPVDGNATNLMWELNDASGGYMLGQFDGATFTPSTAKLPGELGSGFYASQTFTSMAPGDNRKVRICWAQLGMPGMPYNQAMFFPTVLTLNTGSAGVQLCSQPVAEITNNVVNAYSWTNLTLNPAYNPWSGIRGGMFDVRAQFAPGSAQAINFVICGVAVTYSPATQQITCNGDTQSLPPLNGIVSLEIVSDRQTVEIFGNGGQLYMPIAGTGYAAGTNTLSLTCTGAATGLQSLTVNELKSIWTDLNH